MTTCAALAMVSMGGLLALAGVWLGAVISGSAPVELTRIFRGEGGGADGNEEADEGQG